MAFVPFHFQVISIHTLRGEGDHIYKVSKPINGISIHTLRGEGDT